MGKLGTPTPLETARPIAAAVKMWLESKEPVLQVEIAGSIRRGKQVVSDVDVVVVTSNMDLWQSRMREAAPMHHWTPKGGVIQLGGMRVEVYPCVREDFGAQMLFNTGPARFNVYTRTLAMKNGWRLSQHGLWETKTGGVRIDTPTGDFATDEAEILARLNVAALTPEQRGQWSRHVEMSRVAEEVWD